MRCTAHIENGNQEEDKYKLDVLAHKEAAGNNGGNVLPSHSDDLNDFDGLGQCT